MGVAVALAVDADARRPEEFRGLRQRLSFVDRRRGSTEPLWLCLIVCQIAVVLRY